MGTNNAINLGTQGVAYYNGSGTFSVVPVTQFGVAVGAGANNLATLAVGTNGQVLVGSTGANPAFSTLTSSNGSISFTTGAGTLSIQGTQATTAQLGSVTLATNAEAIAGTDTSKVITPDDLKAKLGTQTANAMPYGAGNNMALLWTTALTNGQVVIGSTGGAPAAANLTAGTGVSITNGSNTITINALGGGLTWHDNTTTPITAAANNGYIADNAGATVAYTLPSPGTVGDTIQIVGGVNASTTAPWTIAVPAGEKLHFGSAVFAGQTLAATNQFDCVELVCIVAGANAEWLVVDSVGNITYT